MLSAPSGFKALSVSIVAAAILAIGGSNGVHGQDPPTAAPSATPPADASSSAPAATGTPATPSPAPAPSFIGPPAPAEAPGSGTSSAAAEESENGGNHGIRRTAPDPLPLPSWSPADARALAAGVPLNHGGGLFPRDVFPLAFTAGRDGAAARLSGPDAAPPPLVSTLVDPPPTRLADPGNLLAPRRASTVRQFLASHDAECRFPLRVIALPDDPAKLGITAAALRDRWFGPQDPTVVLCYTNDAPSHSALGFSQQTHADYRPADLDLVLRGPILETTNVNAPHQIEAFLLRLSIELAALEKKPRLPPVPVAAAAQAPSAAAARAAAPQATIRRGFRWTTGKTVALLLAAAAALGARLYLIARQRQKPVIFPPTELHPRLGAMHSGGAGSVMTFE